MGKICLITGPVPVFFSENPDITLHELKTSPEWAFQCLQGLVSRLLVRGQLSRYTVPGALKVILLINTGEKHSCR